jgi:hypothetical protein
MPELRSSITLRALAGQPLRDRKVRDIVIATASAIAERNGVTLTELAATDDSITAELAANRLVALGFAAELRRVTGAWFAHKNAGQSLWGEPLEPDDQRDEWSI